MEPRREGPKAPTPLPEEKPQRFRLIKLEPRIAPKGNGGHYSGTGDGYGGLTSIR